MVTAGGVSGVAAGESPSRPPLLQKLAPSGEPAHALADERCNSLVQKGLTELVTGGHKVLDSV